jgi:hypothetical protein
MTGMTDAYNVEQEVRCPRLGHQIRFDYCRIENFGKPCRKCVSCWSDKFDVRQVLSYPKGDDCEDYFDAPPEPKIVSLIELIERAKKTLPPAS